MFEIGHMLDKDLLVESLTYPMPFGKFKSRPVADLPVFYLEWFLRKNNEFPKGKLGDIMAIVYQIKLNGLDDIIEKLRQELK